MIELQVDRIIDEIQGFHRLTFWGLSLEIWHNNLDSYLEEGINEATVQFVGGGFGLPKTKDFLPLYAPYKKRQYDGQTKTPDSFRLLLV